MILNHISKWVLLIRINWVSMNESKFGGSCLVCEEWISAGNPIMWKKDIGILHADCHLKIEKIEELTNDTIFYFSQRLFDESHKCLNQIKELKNEIGVESSFQLSSESQVDIKKLFLQHYDQLKNDPKWIKLAEFSFQTFHKHFKKMWYDFFINFGIDFFIFDNKIKEVESQLDGVETDDTENIHNKLKELKKKRKDVLEMIRKESKLFYDSIRPKTEIIFDPSHPYENRVLFKKLLANSSKHLFWVDKYFDNNSLEVLMSHLDFQMNEIKLIKILSSIDKIKKIEDFKNKFQILQKELVENQDVEIQLKLITNKQNNKDKHDRYLITDNNVFGGVSIGYMFKSNCIISPLVEKNNEEEIRNLVDGWWNSPDTLHIVNDWEKIDSILKNEIYFKYDCDVCKNTFYKENKVNSSQKYCPTCFPKYMR